MTRKVTRHEIATALHRARIRFCWGNDDGYGRYPWAGSPPGKWPGDFEPHGPFEYDLYYCGHAGWD